MINVRVDAALAQSGVGPEISSGSPYWRALYFAKNRNIFYIVHDHFHEIHKSKKLFKFLLQHFLYRSTCTTCLLSVSSNKQSSLKTSQNQHFQLICSLICSALGVRLQMRFCPRLDKSHLLNSNLNSKFFSFVE